MAPELATNPSTQFEPEDGCEKCANSVLLNTYRMVWKMALDSVTLIDAFKPTRAVSELTSSLMGNRRSPPGKWAGLLSVVADRLVEHYGVPTLGNFRDPVKEIFYILLSARTTERLYRPAHKRLFREYPSLDSLASARPRSVLKLIDVAGLGHKRAAQTVGIARQLLSRLGRNPARALRKMSAAQAYRFLIALPGVGPKSALCVMMCSLDHDVFPVDINVQRVMERLGAMRPGLKHYQAQKLAPKRIPTGRCKELHVGLLTHGRQYCIPRRPKCGDCFLVDLCRYGKRVVRKTP